MGCRPDRTRARPRRARRASCSAAKGLLPAVAFTSLQTRAIRTLHLALQACGRLWIPETKDWRLNERHYGGLTGLDKAETAAKHGDEQVKIWRRSFDIPPPPMDAGGPYDLAADARYAGIAIPATESLKDTIARVLPYYETAIVPALKAGRDGDRLGPRQFAARAGEAPLGHFRCGHHRARNSHRRSRSSMISTPG